MQISRYINYLPPASKAPNYHHAINHANNRSILSRSDFKETHSGVGYSVGTQGRKQLTHL